MPQGTRSINLNHSLALIACYTVFADSIFNLTSSNFRIFQHEDHVLPGQQALDSFIVGLYAEIFRSVVSLVNRSVAKLGRHWLVYHETHFNGKMAPIFLNAVLPCIFIFAEL